MCQRSDFCLNNAKFQKEMSQVGGRRCLTLTRSFEQLLHNSQTLQRLYLLLSLKDFHRNLMDFFLLLQHMANRQIDSLLLTVKT